MKKWIFIILAVAAIIWASVAAYRHFAGRSHKEASYQTEPVQRRDIASSVQATGVIRAKVGAEVKVGSRISGRVEKLYANIGDVVRQGQLIARIEQRDLEARVNEAKMGLAIAQANLDLVKKNLQRMRNLFASDFVSRDKVDIAEKDFATAEAQVRQAKEAVSFQETQRSYASLHAPISGVIASVATQQGETVSATAQNVPTFVSIVDLNRLEVYAYVDETDIGKVSPGMAAAFTVDSFPDKEFKGTISAIYPKATIQDNVIYYITLISIENSEGKLKPDMTATATLLLNKKSGVLAVPTRAIRREGGKKVVQILERGRPVQKVIKTGVKDGSYTEIIEGVTENNLVITGEGQNGGEK